jgi:hypothetical protein
VQAKDFLNYVVEFEQLTKLELWTDRNLVLRNGGRAGGLVFDSAKKKKKNEQTACPKNWSSVQISNHQCERIPTSPGLIFSFAGSVLVSRREQLPLLPEPRVSILNTP